MRRCSVASWRSCNIAGLARSAGQNGTTRAGLQRELARLSEDFNSSLEAACVALQPSSVEVNELGPAQAYSARFAKWREASRYRDLFSAIAIAIPRSGEISLQLLDMATGRFAPSSWPSEWEPLHEQLLARVQGRHPEPMALDRSNLFEIPRFGPPPRIPGRATNGGTGVACGGAEPGHDANARYSPNLLAAYLGPRGYRAEVFVRGDPSRLIYRSDDGRSNRQGCGWLGQAFSAFASLRFHLARPGRREPPRRPPFGPPPPSGNGRWQLVAQSEAGSLDALVERTRRGNLAVSAVILALLIATVGLLARFSRQAQRLADLQMNFVAGVSHELRTPLTVIRTAAFNLKGNVAHNPSQVERYGGLIQEESEKLTAIVEQILRFSSTRAGRIIADKSSVQVEYLIDSIIHSRQHLLDSSGFKVEKTIEPDVPPILGDSTALHQAIQNLVDNAVKYGRDLVQISARKIEPDSVRISVIDNGPGIPIEERSHVFDPFFRGQRAIQDQIHGTGLGLHLVKEIVEAHGGTIEIHNEPLTGTEFRITFRRPGPGDTG